MRYALLTATVLMLVACQRGAPDTQSATPPAEPPPPAAFQPPTATELFHLRGECAQLAEKMRGEYQSDDKLHAYVESNFDRHENRCYVRVIAVTADKNVPFGSKAYYQAQLLYDGQTQDLLAHIEIKNGEQTGAIFKGGPQGDYWAAVRYISAKMKDQQ